MSHVWLCQLQRILARLGEVAYVSRGRPNTTEIEGRRGVNAQPLHELYVYKMKSRRSRKAWVANGSMYRKIRSITREDFCGTVYNCEVEEDHSYVSATNALVYKNCNVMNNPSDELTATFKAEWLLTYDWLDQDTLWFPDGTGAKHTYRIRDLDIMFFVDPGGFGVRQIEDRSRAAVVVVGTTGATHCILDVYCEKDTFLACIQQIVSWVTRYQPRKLVIERAGQQGAFIQLVREHLHQAGLTVTIDEVRPSKVQKEVRVLGLEPYFQRGEIRIGKGPNFHEFRTQYAQFPRASHLDVLDALAYLSQYARKMPGTAQQSPAQRRAQELAAYRHRRGLTHAAH